MDSATVGFLLMTILSWGLWGFFHKIGVSKMGVETCLLLNYFTTFLVVMSYLALVQRLQIPTSAAFIYPVLGGLSGATGSIAFFTALEKIPVSIARPMAGLCVLITALLGFLLLGETLTIKQYVGVGLAIAAIILLSS